MPKRKKIKLVTPKDATIIDDSKLKKTITAASLGNIMEWFDFGVYSFVVYALDKVFFPDTSPSMQMIAALGISSVPSLIRPLDGLFFGMLGDRYGQQKILATIIMITSTSTFCIGLIPSYTMMGVWAPTLLLLCKMAQGFPVGGEYTGASTFVAEYSPDRKRGFMSSWLGFDSVAEFMMGVGVVVLISSVMEEQNFLDRGWRIPFFLALPLDITGLYPCHALKEAPAFQQHMNTMEQGDREGLRGRLKVSFRGIATKHWHNLLTCIGLMISTNIIYYMLLTYMLSYLSHNLHYSEDHGVLIIIAIMVGMLFVRSAIGMLNDCFGRRPFTLIGSMALFALAIPTFIMINSNVIGLIFTGLLLLTVVLNCFTGVMAFSLPVTFPAHTRFSALASVSNISVLVAGLTPTPAAQLVKTTQNLMMSAYYLMVIMVVRMVTGLSMKETANHPPEGATPATSDIQGAKEILGEYYDNIRQEIEDISQEIADLQTKRPCLVQQYPRIND